MFRLQPPVNGVPAPARVFLRAWKRGVARLGGLLALAAALGCGPRAFGVAALEPRTPLPGSIREVRTTQAAGDSRWARIVRSSLNRQEAAAPMDFSIALRMRNFPELQQRLARGEQISFAEMQEKYFPLQADYDALADWLEGEGFTVTQRTSSRLGIFARGSVARVSQAFEAAFARVQDDGREYTAAVTAPSVPASLAPVLVGVNGLQPFLRKQPRLTPHDLQPNSATANAPPYFPAQLARAYNGHNTGYNGAGETIGIVMSGFPLASDLTQFWSTVGSPQTLANITFLPVGTGPIAGPFDLETEEACLDVQWSSAIAPAAKVRVYGTASLADSQLNLAYQQIYDDAVIHPEYGMHQVSLSYGGIEIAFSFSQLQTDAQYFAMLASVGITVIAASGDAGSRPTFSGYSASATLSAETPASDPSVLSVGGTSITLDLTSGSIVSETVWAGGGGGQSVAFQRPVWQTGTGVLGTYVGRLVPDVAAAADPVTGCMIMFNGVQTTVGGTSWSAPVWAGFCALINQARAMQSAPSLGLLTPRIYPLMGTSSFRDVISGSNGTDGNYTAGTGFDLCTGLGTPNVAVLLQQLTTVLTPPANQELRAGHAATFAVLAGPAAMSYRWQRMPSGSATWTNLGDDATYNGAFTDTLMISNTTAGMSGDQFQCVINTASSFSITPPATLIVIGQDYIVTTIGGQAGVSGSDDGAGTNALFSLPNDVALDTSGNLYIADTNNDTVRRMLANGTVTTIAGLAGVNGNANGTGSAARFNFNNSLDIGPSGNIYVADSNNNNIRRVTPTGVVTTFAGSASGLGGSTNSANPNNARFNFPAGIAVDSGGNVYVADSYNNTIRKITPAGNVTTLAGRAGFAGFADATGTNARFNFPAAVAVDASGNVFVADANNNVIRKVTQAGVVTTVAGLFPYSGVADGPSSSARFNYPSGLSLDVGGNIYVTDTNNHSIRKITPAGMVSTVAGKSGEPGTSDGIGEEAEFNQPYGVVIDPAGNLYIADTFNDTIRKVVPAAAPQVLLQPQAVTALAGASANFSTNANGAPNPTYQWQRLDGSDWVDLSDDGVYSGTHTANLTINTVTTGMDGDHFRCVIGNSYGSVASSSIALTVHTPPSISQQPQSAAVSAGDEALFTVLATGLPLPSYQWQVLAPGGTWMDLEDDDFTSGSNSPTLTLTDVVTTQGGSQYRCVATNGVSPAATSNAATLTVYPPGYLTWAAGLNLTGTSADPSAKSQGGVLPNLARFAMNLGASGQAAGPGYQVIGGTLYLTLQYRQLKSLAETQLVPQFSTNLADWQAVPPGNITQLSDADPQTARYEARVAVPPDGVIFLRVDVIPAP